MGRTELLLKNAMEAQYGNVKAFSEAVGIPYSTVRSILERGVRKANVGNVLAICEKLGIPAAVLESVENKRMIIDEDRTYVDNTTDIMKSLNTDSKRRVFEYAMRIKEGQEVRGASSISYIPVTIINKVSAGTGYMYGENGDEVVYAKEPVKPYDFAVSAKGDSMEPLINNGDAVLCRKDFDFSNGCLYIVDYDGESYVKRVYDIGHQLRLVSENNSYEDIFLDKDERLRIVGAVVDWFTPAVV